LAQLREVVGHLIPSHTSGVLPKARERRIAISGDMPLLRLTRLLSA
jgi:hypothetical protein